MKINSHCLSFLFDLIWSILPPLFFSYPDNPTYCFIPCIFSHHMLFPFPSSLPFLHWWWWYSTECDMSSVRFPSPLPHTALNAVITFAPCHFCPTVIGGAEMENRVLDFILGRYWSYWSCACRGKVCGKIENFKNAHYHKWNWRKAAMSFEMFREWRRGTVHRLWRSLPCLKEQQWRYDTGLFTSC